MGWNEVQVVKPHPVLAGIEPGDEFYFVHGYYAQPEESPSDPLTSTTCSYGSSFCASVWLGNVWATQFHPEKSSAAGSRLLANFLAL